jgi:hypothetical protein
VSEMAVEGRGWCVWGRRRPEKSDDGCWTRFVSNLMAAFLGEFVGVRFAVGGHAH